MTSPSRVRLTLSGDVVKLDPVMPPARWDAYHEATEGARYDKTRRARVTSLDRVPVLLQRLRAADFDVRIKPGIEESIDKWNIAQWFEFENARSRIEAVDAEIFSQNGQHLRPYQRTGAMWMTFRKGGILADQPGLGKTRTVLVALPPGSPVIIVAPMRVKAEWLREVRLCRPHLKVTIFRKREDFRPPESGELVVLHYQILPEVHDPRGQYGRKCEGFFPAEKCKGCDEKLVDRGRGPEITKEGFHLSTCTGLEEPRRCPGCNPILKKIPKGTVFVIDEGQKIKNSKTQMTNRARGLSRSCLSNDGRVWILSGTPLENSPKDLWSLFTTAGVAEEAFDTRDKFLELFAAEPKIVHGQHRGYDWGEPDDTGDLKRRLRSVSLRRMKADVARDLPKKQIIPVTVEVDREAILKCDKFLKALGTDITRLVELVERDGFDFQTMSEIRQALATAKIPAMLDYVADFEEQNEPLIVFSCHRLPIEALQKRPGWGVVMGGESEKKVNETLDAFRAGKLKGLALTVGSGGTGLNLTKACEMIVVDLHWNPAVNEQAEDRFWRLGQVRGVTVRVLTANHPLDERVTQVLLAKRNIIEKSIDRAKVVDDAPEDVDFEEQYMKFIEDIRRGIAPRRDATKPEEEAALTVLHRAGVLYPTRSDARLGHELAEQATTVGLSDAQWRLVLEVAARGILPAEEAGI